MLGIAELLIILEQTVPHFFQISSAINEFSVRHQQDLIVSTLHHKPLSEPTYVKSFDFRLDSSDSGIERDSVSVSLKISDSGMAHAIVYWYAPFVLREPSLGLREVHSLTLITQVDYWNTLPWVLSLTGFLIVKVISKTDILSRDLSCCSRKSFWQSNYQTVHSKQVAKLPIQI